MRERCACCDQTFFPERMSHSATWPVPPAETSRSPCEANPVKNQDTSPSAGRAAAPKKVSAFFLVARSHDSMASSERHTAKVWLSGEKLIRPSVAAGSVKDSQLAVFQRRILRRSNEAASHWPSGE